MTLRQFVFFGLVFFVAAQSALAQKSPPSAVDFQRVVRPILSDACFHCHGPDPNTRLADLRLDTRDGAFAKRENGTPVVSGQPNASLIYQRITDSDPSRRMPPEYSHKTLTSEQKGIIKRWIEEGASWKEHWAFSAPVRPELPAVKKTTWSRNPIDAFILARLEAAGLEPAPEADRRTLVRRLSLDLTGLPPEPKDVEDFVNDNSKDAYEKLVDRFLKSEHWGEHRGRYWLDAARYADTHGIHVDNYREMWPYRDWVIDAFNRNLSFDRFTIEQIAGDLLPERTFEQQIASGFHRCSVSTNEGGVIAEEVEAMYAKDRVDTTGTVFLGLTVGCATCHDHKFDPISTKDFYSLTAFFRNTTQPTMDGNVPDTPPVVVVPREDDRQRWNRLNSEDTEIRKRMQQERRSAGRGFEKWLHSRERSSLSEPLDAGSRLLSILLGEAVKLDSHGQTTAIALPEGVTMGPAPVDGRRALHFDASGKLELPNQEYFSSDKPFSLSAWVHQPKREDNFIVASQSDPEDKNRGWGLEINARQTSFRLVGDEGKSIRVSAGFFQQWKPGTWHHIAVTYDGSRQQAGLALYVDGKQSPIQIGDQIQPLPGEIRTRSPLRLGNEGTRFFHGGAIADFRLYTRAITEEEAQLASLWPVMESYLSKAEPDLKAEEKDAFHLYYLNHRDSGYKKLAARQQALAVERREIRKRGAVTLVMQEKPDSKPMAHILFRGQYDQPRDAVEPNVPAALPPMPASFPRNRLGLAQWLVQPSNPLMARVTVNRFWQEIFGTGIVKTSEDFGSQGQAPSHPELLDWLAVEFRESGWDVKKFFRLMVTSAAYRQSASTTAEKLGIDPDNRLLSRGPRFRMDAEMVRDYALSAGELLVPTIGGPSVKPYQPDGIWEAVAMLGSNTRFYKRESGDKLYRRSLYTFWKRSAPPASMDIFNAPTRENCTVRRERTNTPLQALATMNGTQFVEASRHLAQLAMTKAGGKIDRELDFITDRVLARAFEERERAIVRKAYEDYRSYYEGSPDDAKKLLSVGESKADPNLKPSDFAALTMIASQVLNLDEALNK